MEFERTKGKGEEGSFFIALIFFPPFRSRRLERKGYLNCTCSPPPLGLLSILFQKVREKEEGNGSGRRNRRRMGKGKAV